MPKIVPSQVVDLIDQIFPGAETSDNFSINRGHSNTAAAIVELIDQIPTELLVLPAEKYAALISAVASLRTTIEVWKMREWGLDKTPGFGKINPILLIRREIGVKSMFDP
jgi:hypothetical protein